MRTFPVHFDSYLKSEDNFEIHIFHLDTMKRVSLEDLSQRLPETKLELMLQIELLIQERAQQIIKFRI